MKPFLNTVLFLVWVVVYLTGVSWITQYRRARARPLGSPARTEYRADKDIGLWLAVFVMGVMLLFAAYLGTWVLNQVP